jgi:hypothetical protein
VLWATGSVSFELDGQINSLFQANWRKSLTEKRRDEANLHVLTDCSMFFHCKAGRRFSGISNFRPAGR